MLRLLDANILITAHNSYYAIDAVPEFWAWLANRAEAGHIKMPKEIYDEIKDGGTDKEKDLLYEWIQQPAIKAALVLKEEVDPALVQKVIAEGYADDLDDVEIEKLGRDPFLIAYGLAAPNRAVVSAEVSQSSKQRANRKVPDVCTGFGVPCGDIFKMIIKDLKFTTNWDKVG